MKQEEYQEIRTLRMDSKIIDIIGYNRNNGEVEGVEFYIVVK
jgi:hypothetical protein